MTKGNCNETKWPNLKLVICDYESSEFIGNWNERRGEVITDLRNYFDMNTGKKHGASQGEPAEACLCHGFRVKGLSIFYLFNIRPKSFLLCMCIRSMNYNLLILKCFVYLNYS